MWCINVGTIFCHFVTMHAFETLTDGLRTDRQTDRRTEGPGNSVRCSTCTHTVTERVAIAMHCNVWPPHIAPAVLGFYYEAHVPAYKSNNSAMDVSVITEHSQCLWQNSLVCCACEESVSGSEMSIIEVIVFH